MAKSVKELEQEYLNAVKAEALGKLNCWVGFEKTEVKGISMNTFVTSKDISIKDKFYLLVWLLDSLTETIGKLEEKSIG